MRVSVRVAMSVSRQTILLVINDALCAEPNLFLIPLNVCVCVCVCV